MKLTAQVKLLPTPEQAERLKQTLEQMNAICNAISNYAWENKRLSRNALQKALYYSLRGQLETAAQVAIRCG